MHRAPAHRKVFQAIHVERKRLEAPDVIAEWVAAQNRVTDAYLESIPGRERLKQRMTELYNYERVGVPVKKGRRYFYQRNTGLQNQSPLYVQEGLAGERRIEHRVDLQRTARGPHRGRMLRDGNFALEVTIFETGVPPQFRAYLFEDGKPVPPGGAKVTVELHRLGGRVLTLAIDLAACLEIGLSALRQRRLPCSVPCRR